MWAQSRSVVDPKTDEKRFTAAQVDNNWQGMDVLTVLDVLIEPNAAVLVDGNSLVAALENIELVSSEFFVSRYYETLEHQLTTIYLQFIWFMRIAATKKARRRFALWNAPLSDRLRVSASTS